MQLGNVAAVEADIAQIFLATDECHVANDLDGATTFGGNQLSTHGSMTSFGSGDGMEATFSRDTSACQAV